MARPRKPTRVLELTGAFRKNPQRRAEREGEPVVTAPLGNPPECLNESEQARWKEIHRDATWLNRSHRAIVEQTCRLWMLERDRKASIAERKLLASNLGALGMTPSTSSRVKVPPAKPKKNAFQALTG